MALARIGPKPGIVSRCRKVAPELRHRRQGVSERRRDAGSRRIGQDCRQLADVARPFGCHDAELGHQAAQLVDHFGSAA
jgi:hypothetical protein